MANELKPNSVKKINHTTLAFKCMENINEFLRAAMAFGVPTQETFQTVDLWERQNLNAVVICLQSLGRKVMIFSYFYSIQIQITNQMKLMNINYLIFRLEISGSLALDPKKLRRTFASSPRNN